MHRLIGLTGGESQCIEVTYCGWVTNKMKTLINPLSNMIDHVEHLTAE